MTPIVRGMWNEMLPVDAIYPGKVSGITGVSDFHLGVSNEAVCTYCRRKTNNTHKPCEGCGACDYK